MADMDDFYEPWTYDFEHLHNSPKKKNIPVARPKSMITGKFMDKPEWGPNWDDDLAGGSEMVPTGSECSKAAGTYRDGI